MFGDRRSWLESRNLGIPLCLLYLPYLPYLLTLLTYLTYILTLLGGFPKFVPSMGGREKSNEQPLTVYRMPYTVYRITADG